MILIAGATGTVGRRLVLELKTRRAALRVLTRDPEKARRLLGPVECVVGDLARPETLAKALSGVEAAFLLSPLDPSLPAWEAAFARAAGRARVNRLVKLSVLGADPRSASAVARWHGESEEEIKRTGLAFTLLRPAPYYQDFLVSADSIRRGVLPAPLGTARVALVDADDVGAAAAAALSGAPSLAGQTLTLTGPAPLCYAEVASAFSRALGRPVAYADVRPEDARRGMLAAGAPAWRIDAVLGFAELLRGGLADAAADGVLRAAGREPASLESFVRGSAAAFA
ncbi:MAG TPA: NAD(P)H-binding protein [Elusimicrobiota bacterium]|jgi:uncharacterized protein YbjT (DUF2867 family)|nr:NAD(P)H-binding protein [Elusimicrobiota bacterium]